MQRHPPGMSLNSFIRFVSSEGKRRKLMLNVSEQLIPAVKSLRRVDEPMQWLIAYQNALLSPFKVSQGKQLSKRIESEAAWEVGFELRV